MWNLFKLQSKTFFRNKGSYFVFFFPVIIIMSLGTFMPETSVANFTIWINIISLSLFQFGVNYQGFKSSTLVKNMSLTTISPFQVVFTFSAFTALLIGISTVSLFGIIYLLSAAQLGFLYPLWFDETKETAAMTNWTGRINWQMMHQTIIPMLVSLISTTILGCAMGYFISSISKNAMTLTLFSVFYICLLFATTGSSTYAKLSSMGIDWLPDYNIDNSGLKWTGKIASKNGSFPEVVGYGLPHWWTVQYGFYVFNPNSFEWDTTTYNQVSRLTSGLPRISSVYDMYSVQPWNTYTFIPTALDGDNMATGGRFVRNLWGWGFIVVPYIWTVFLIAVGYWWTKSKTSIIQSSNRVIRKIRKKAIHSSKTLKTSIVSMKDHQINSKNITIKKKWKK